MQKTTPQDPGRFTFAEDISNFDSFKNPFAMITSIINTPF